jgi:GNAT superfamily N-acetyltransferase
MRPVTAPTEIAIAGLPLETLEAAAADRALALSAEIGWNQTADDWRLMIGAGHAVGLRGESGRLVATALVLPLGPEFAWISMVLVSASYRRRGIATGLLRYCIADIEGRGLVAGLDATPAGREIYIPLGFVDILETRRLQALALARAAPRLALAGVCVRAMAEADLEAAIAFDGPCHGGERGFLLRHLFAHCPGDAWIAERNGAVAGYALARDGRDYHHLGPVVAVDEAVAMVLTDAALERIEGPVQVDAASAHGAFNARLARRGFTPQRPFTRMLKGRAKAFGDASRIFAIAGPEFG